MRAAAVLLLAAVLALGTAGRVAVWGDERALWFEAVQMSPLKPRPWANLGRELSRSGSMDLAAYCYTVALERTDAPDRSFDEHVYGRRVIAANLERVTRDYNAWFRAE